MCPWSALISSTALARSSDGDWSISDRSLVSPSTLQNVARSPMKGKSIWARRPRAYTDLSPRLSSAISSRTHSTAGNLSIILRQAKYLHAHLVSLSFWSSLGLPPYMSFWTSSHLWCTYEPDMKTYSFSSKENKHDVSGTDLTVSTKTKFKQCALLCT